MCALSSGLKLTAPTKSTSEWAERAGCEIESLRNLAARMQRQVCVYKGHTTCPRASHGRRKTGWSFTRRDEISERWPHARERKMYLDAAWARMGPSSRLTCPTSAWRSQLYVYWQRPLYARSTAASRPLTNENKNGRKIFSAWRNLLNELRKKATSCVRASDQNEKCFRFGLHVKYVFCRAAAAASCPLSKQAAHNLLEISCGAAHFSLRITRRT